MYVWLIVPKKINTVAEAFIKFINPFYAETKRVFPREVRLLMHHPVVCYSLSFSDAPVGTKSITALKYSSEENDFFY